MSPSNSNWRTEYRDATQTPPAGAKERVWRNLSAPRSSSRFVVPLFALSAAAAALVIGLAVWPRTKSNFERLDGFAYRSTDAVFERTGHRFVLREGRLAINAWEGPVFVETKGHRVVVEHALAVVEVAGEAVHVLPAEGVTLLDDVVARPTAQTRAAVSEREELVTVEPSEALIVRAESEARAASHEHRWAEAAAALSVVATSSSLRAEAALLKRGELELRELHTPAAALATFDEGDTRFPDGTLAEERALSALEATVALNRWADGVRRADDFSTRFPKSHRISDVQRVRALALQAQETTRPSGP